MENTKMPGLTDEKEIEIRRKKNEDIERRRIATMKDSSTQAFLNFKMDTNERLDKIEKALDLSSAKERTITPKAEKPANTKDFEVSKD